MKIEVKLLKYLKKRRIKKLYRFIEKYEIDIHSFCFTDGDSMLHKFCFYGLFSCLRQNFKSKSLFLKKNFNEQLPIHAAINGGLQRLSRDDHDLVNLDDIVNYIKTVCPESFGMSDIFGSSAEMMFKMYKNMTKNKVCESPKHENEDFEECWQESYTAGYEEEEDDDATNYFNSFSDACYETWDEWAERISKERRQKKQSEYHFSFPQAKKKTNPESLHVPKISPDEIKAFEENMRKLNQSLTVSQTRQKYEVECDKFFKKQSAPGKISFKDIPWPHPHGGSISEIDGFLFAGLDRASSEFKAILKKQQIRWHPDRFMNRCQSNICSKDRAKILKHVVEISQYFNGLITSL